MGLFYFIIPRPVSFLIDYFLRRIWARCRTVKTNVIAYETRSSVTEKGAAVSVSAAKTNFLREVSEVEHIY
jgi:hypothetical protein